MKISMQVKISNGAVYKLKHLKFQYLVVQHIYSRSEWEAQPPRDITGMTEFNVPIPSVRARRMDDYFCQNFVSHKSKKS